MEMSMTKPALRSAYIPHEPVDLLCEDISRTRQEFADECDINLLMARYEKSGVLPPSHSDLPPVYFDTTMFTMDFREAMDMLNAADAAFMQLPAAVRKEFDNDPAAFVEYATNPANVDKLREWGLAKPAALPEPPMRVEVVSPPPPSPPAPPAA